MPLIVIDIVGTRILYESLFLYHNSLVTLQSDDSTSFTGFSYDPQLFMDNGIFHYNFGWDDYGVTTISTLLDMVRVFKFATDEGKVAVHCHAGDFS